MKGLIHQTWDESGPYTRGLREKLKPNTLRSWFAAFAREAGTGRVKGKVTKVAKSKSKVKANGTEATANA
jgi:hypothetical protein